MSTDQIAGKRPTIIEARTAVGNFLRDLLADAQQVKVTRLVQLNAEEGTWDAEAEVWQPSAAMQALGLPLTRPVLDPHTYLVRLDRHLNVLGYEISEQE
jgi:hypothetical protein